VEEGTAESLSLTPSQVKDKLSHFLSSFGSRKAGTSFTTRVAAELDLEAASPQKLRKIVRLMERLTPGKKPGLNSGQNAAAMLTTLISKWEKER